MPLICSRCGKEIDSAWQDNMSNDYMPLCEDCYNYVEEEVTNYNRQFLEEYIMEYEADKYGFYM